MNLSKYFISERSPYLGEPPKMIAAEIGAALVSGASGFLGGLLGNKSTSKTNRTNLEIANRYNQTQIDLANMNNKFNRAMWLEQQAYNTPANQMQRYRDAGINPYMALGQMSNGNAESAVTGTMPNTAAPPNMQQKDYSFVGNSINMAAQSALAAAQAIKANKEATGQGLQNQYDESTMQSRIDMQKYNTDVAKWIRNIKEFDFNLYARTFENRVKLSDLSVQQVQQSIYQSQAETADIMADAAFKHAQTRLTDNQSKQLKYYLDNILPQQLDNMKKQGKLLDEQTRTEISKQAANYADVNLKDAQASEIDELIEYKVQAYAYDNQAKDLSNSMAFDTYDFNLSKSRNESIRSGIYPWQSRKGFSVNLPFIGKTGFEVTDNSTRTTNWNYETHSQEPVHHRKKVSTPKIKLKSRRYSYKHY